MLLKQLLLQEKRQMLALKKALNQQTLTIRQQVLITNGTFLQVVVVSGV
jgi:hypothetical protein